MNQSERERASEREREWGKGETEETRSPDREEEETQTGLETGRDLRAAEVPGCWLLAPGLGLKILLLG